MNSTNLDRILAKIEYFVAWALVAFLSVIGLSIVTTQPIYSCFYFLIAFVLYPHNSIRDYQRFIIVFVAFVTGMWLGLV